jgi:hypothetical protein
LGLAGRVSSVWRIHHNLRIPFATPAGGYHLQQNLPAGTVTAVFAQAFSTASGRRKQAMLQKLR